MLKKKGGGYKYSNKEPSERGFQRRKDQSVHCIYGPRAQRESAAGYPKVLWGGCLALWIIWMSMNVVNIFYKEEESSAMKGKENGELLHLQVDIRKRK